MLDTLYAVGVAFFCPVVAGTVPAVEIIEIQELQKGRISANAILGQISGVIKS